MDDELPVIYIARHGETAWTISGQHTGLTDLPLTPQGERNAQALGDRLKGMTFAKVLTSPLPRAGRTCAPGRIRVYDRSGERPGRVGLQQL
jgi:broad specificity phosphatase PhoE